MGDITITTNLAPRSVYDPYTHLNPPKEVVQKKLLFSKDTIAPAVGADEAVLGLSSLHRPKIEAPDADVEDVSLDINKMETILRQDYIDCVKEHQASYRIKAELEQETVGQIQKVNKTLQEKILKDWDKQIDRSWFSKLLNWVNWVFFGIAAGAGIASVGIAILSGGAGTFAAVGVAAGIAAAMATIASGTMTIGKGILDYKNGQLTGEIQGTKWLRIINSKKIKTALDDMMHSIQKIYDHWRQLFQETKNWLAAALNK